MNPPCPTNHTHTVYKYGFQAGKQMYWCRECRKKFSGLGNYPGRQFPAEMVWHSITFYMNGMSYENVRHTLQDLGYPPVDKTTIWEWVVAYSDLVRRWALAQQPRLGGVWVADETVIKVDGAEWWYWDVIDYQTRYLLSTLFTKTRGMANARRLFERAMVASKVSPRMIITDKLKDYWQPIRTTLGVPHVTSKGFDSDVNTNLIERFQGTIKQRTKVMRHFKDPRCASIVLDGYICHYNYLMEREHLQGQTPAVLAGVGHGVRHWGDLIAMAYQTARMNPIASMDIPWLVAP